MKQFILKLQNVKTKKTATFFMSAALLFLTFQAKSAQVNNTCQDLNDVDYIVEPWHEATRTFAQGKVRVIHVDTLGEPVCCSSHLLILVEDKNAELGERKCMTVSQSSRLTGFLNLDVNNIKVLTENASTLKFELPVKHYNEDGSGDPATVTIEIDIENASAKVLK